MKKATKFLFGIFTFSILISSMALAQINEPDGLRMPGDWNSFGNSNGMGGDFDLVKISSGTIRWTTTFQFTGSSGSQNFKFASTSFGNDWGNQWAQVTGISLDTITSVPYTTNGGVGNNSISLIENNWYTVNWKDNGYATTDFIFMETSAEPIDISSSAVDSVTSDTVYVGITLSGSKSSEELVYVRYSNDDFSTSKHVLASGSGTSYQAALPFTDDIDYYILTTTVNLGSDNSTYSGDYDMATIDLENNGGSNYSYEYGFSNNLTGSAGFRLMSSPVTTSYSDVLDEIWTQGATTGADVTNGDPNVFTWDNSSAGDANTNWDGVTDLSGNITSGEGFLVYVYADDDYDDSDDAFPKTLSVSGTENTAGATPTINSNGDGWTLLGNPFATTIDFDNLTTDDITGVAYVWDDASSEWKTYPQQSGLGDLTDGLIAPFQGFFVQTTTSPTSASVEFPSGAKSTGGSFYGKTSESLSYLRLNVEGAEVSNSAWIQLSAKGSSTSKVMGDAVELQPLSPKYAQLGFMKGDEVMDIANVAATEEIILPVEFNTTEGGTFTISATDFVIPGDVEVLFHDYQMEVSMRIDGEFSYSFETVKLKKQDVPALSMLTAGAMKAKSTEANRFGISIRPTSVSNETEDSPAAFALEQNYPNPFNPSTTISYSVQEAGAVTISVYNLMGQKVATLVDETKAAGQYNVRWNAAGAASGMYYYRLEAGGQSITRKMTLIK